jgi:probable rRNA maturation factor
MTAPDDGAAAGPLSVSTSGLDGDAEDPEPSGRLDVDWVVESGDWSAFEPLDELVRSAAAAVAARPEVASHLPATAVVAFDSDGTVRGLNHRYRGMDKPTNVLSFPAPPVAFEGSDDQIFHIGDIVLAAETVRREADELRVPPQHHLLHLLVHGLLHLMGYDHETEADATAMESLETTILATLGVADPYKEAPA